MAMEAWWMMGIARAGALMDSFSLKILAASSARSWSFVTSCDRRRLRTERDRSKCEWKAEVELLPCEQLHYIHGLLHWASPFAPGKSKDIRG